MENTLYKKKEKKKKHQCFIEGEIHGLRKQF